MVGGAMITLINNADRVKAACLAQLVNVIGAIFAEPGGPAWRQTIFHPFKLASQYGHGSVLRSNVRSGSYSTKTAGDSAQLLAASIHDSKNRRIVLFVLNRSTDAPTDLSIDLRGFAPIQNGKVFGLHGNDLLATNSAMTPDKIMPSEHAELSIHSDKVSTQLPALSWNTLALGY
jgi:alpha-L-arabinofuranosidase